MVTENFVKQCEQAEEIQKAWKPIDYDRFIYKYSRGYGMVWEIIGLGSERDSYIKENCIHIPIQEQLQGLLKRRHIYYLIKDLQIFQVKHTAGLHINDMNELWLAFVMYEKYHKLWSNAGERWVKAN